ncbi:hypothetical protein PHJA_000904100 [Phtheirospermum japonicum]|uniref:Uncharacterized protein n=1 Tax=Phtheirospermum japonicum TaxID=374723 RepID=A0A830BT27_9LAMI|nr:hypothetical protein PHJA_000904100 [Phtheirospermum japonicum]
MFCRLSIKDIITLNHHRKNPISAADEPSSPKVSCMGQVKRNNRVIGFPAAAAGAAVPGATHHHRYSKLKYSKLKKLFSGKTLLPPTAASGGGAAAASAAAGEIDPPLPVVKRAAPPRVGGDEVNLWRRRFNGAAALKGLQIEQITRLPNSNICSQPPTV